MKPSTTKRFAHRSGKATKSKKKVLDWTQDREMWLRVLEKQTGKGLAYWNARIAKEGHADERKLTAWLADQGVTGYAKQLLVRERFGYPDFMTASARELIEGQYADRPASSADL